LKSPHSWNRRDFDVTPNGFFTILKPTRWFSAMRQPGGFRYLVGQSRYLVGQSMKTASPQANENPTENPTAAPPSESTSVPEQRALDHPDIQETAILSQSMIPSTHDHRLMRPALIVLAATAITSILLWWLAHPHP
jgi:hypothetical protein